MVYTKKLRVRFHLASENKKDREKKRRGCGAFLRPYFSVSLLLSTGTL